MIRLLRRLNLNLNNAITMKKLVIVAVSLLLSACKNVPVNVAYTGSAAGHTYTAAYGTSSGVAVVVNQK